MFNKQPTPLTKLKKLLLFLAIVINQQAVAQLADGSVAPDFTLLDLNGTSHNLYTYLDEDKTVFIEIFAAHCPSCWNYHLTERLKNMYQMYGPNGTNELMVLALEYDAGNDGNAFIGIGDPWQTQGNWSDGTPFPLFNVEGTDRNVFTDYNVSFYPLIYKICPNRIVERIMTSQTEAQLYQKVQVCQNALSINEEPTSPNIYINQVSKSLIIEPIQNLLFIKLINLTGQVVKTIDSVSLSSISLNDLKSGIYLFEIHTDSGLFVRRLYLN